MKKNVIVMFAMAVLAASASFLGCSANRTANETADDALNTSSKTRQVVGEVNYWKGVLGK